MYTIRGGRGIFARVPEPPTAYNQRWRSLPEGLDVGELARIIQDTLPEAKDGHWHVGFYEGDRLLFYYKLSWDNTRCQEKSWTHPSDYRHLRDVQCTYLKLEPFGAGRDHTH